MYSIKRWLERTVFVLLVLFLLLLGFWQGVQPQSFTLDLFFVVIEVFWIEAFLAALIFSVFVTLSGFALFYEIWSNDGVETVNEGDLLTVVIPVYRDADVLHRAVESVLKSNYSPMEILIVAERGDEESISVADDLASNYSEVSSIINPGERGKAASINHAVEDAEGEYLAFFDADQLVHPDFIPYAISYLSDFEVVQGRRVSIPEGLVESLSYYEKVIFRLSGQILKLIGFDMVLSSSTVMKKEVFDRMCGYNNSRVTEDLDFGHRCFKNGVKTIKGYRFPTYVEAPHNFRDLWGQKKRWVLGQIQILHGNLSDLLKMQFSKKLIISTFIAGTGVFGNLMMLTLVPKFILLLLLGIDVTAIYPLMVLTLTGLIIRTYDYYSETVENIGWSWIFLVLVYPFYSFIMVKSLLEYIFTWKGEWYHVEKNN